MTRRIILAFIVLLGAACLSRPAAAAASFTAGVDRATVAEGEGFTLHLSLSGTGATESPDLSPLKQAFTIVSQGRSSQTTIINGQVSSSIDWAVTLIPLKRGKTMIPAISLATDAGLLQTRPVEISVVQAAAIPQDENRLVYVQTEITKRNPYRNEPVLLTLRLIAQRSVADVVIPDLQIGHAIAQRQGDPEVYDGTANGHRVKVIETRYLITPLESGPMTVAGTVFQGKIESDRRTDMLGRTPGAYADPFQMLMEFGAMSGFGGWEPFAVSAETITLDVRPPAAQMDPWLPVASLQLLDTWNNADRPKVGEPLSRKLVLMAEGAVGASLPDLQDKIDPQGVARVYADAPVTGEDIKDGKTLEAWREENYTIIPRTPGTLTLPEIRVPWWDVRNNKVAWATVPAKTLTVAPADGAAATPAPAQEPPQQQTQENPQQTQAPPPQQSEQQEEPPQHKAIPRLHIAVAALALAVLTLLGAAASLALLMKRRPATAPSFRTLTENAAPPANEDRITPDSLKKAQTASDLKNLLQSYARRNWNLPANAPLQTVRAELQKRCPEDRIEAQTLFAALEGALYASEAADIETLRDGLAALLRKSASSRIKRTPPRPESGGRLNPS